MNDQWILDRYPLPMARGYRRCRNAVEVRERHDAAYYLFEIYLKYAASVAIAHYLAGEARDHRVNAALKGLARPSLGEWLRFLRECLRFLVEGKEPDPAVLAMAALFEAKEPHSAKLRDLYNALRAFRTGAPSDRDKLSLAMLLEEVVAYRNRVLGHGAPPGKEHLKRFGDLFAGGFPDLLEASPYLTARRLVAFDSLQVEGRTRIECGVVEYMSDRAMRREQPHTIPYGGEAPEKDRLYLLGEDGRFVSLDPLLIAHDEDVCILNEVDGAPEYLSYATGVRHRSSSAGEAQAKLFERILGYRIDASTISRIGDDVQPGPEALAKAPPGDGARKLGDYRIVREVGRGAMGMVFEAVQESLGRRVALKVLPGDFALDPKRVERFRREARATARIHHPSIVPVYDVGEAAGTHFYAMEFIDGPSLDRLIEEARKKSGPAGPGDGKRSGSSSASDPAYIARAVEGMAELAEGLEEAHRQGLIHRDVKPSNILVGADGRHVLVDFGLVREEEATAITRSGEMVGTLAYMSPEQVSRSKVDPRADVYALGATLYEVLTLRTPHGGSSDHEVQRAILFEEPTPARKLNPRLHRDLETVLQKALEKNPERRYASAQELALDLRRFLRYEPIRARSVSLPERAWRWCRKRAALVAVLSVILASGLLSGVLVWRSLADRAHRKRGEVEAKFSAAQKLHGEGRYREALSTLEDVISEQPAPLEARLLLARVLGEMDRTADAIGELEALAIEQPDEGAVHALLAALHRDINPEKAGEHHRRAEKLLPRTAEAFYLRAIASGSLKETLQFLSEALDADPRHYPSHKARAMAHQALRDHASMERDAESMILLRPEDELGYTLRGVARREQRRLDEALKDLDRAVRLAPEDPEVLNHRRETHSRKGNHQQALADARRCAALRPAHVTYGFHVFNALVSMGRFEEANAQYASIVEPGSVWGSVAWRHPDVWLRKHVFNMLGASQPLNLPPRDSPLPVFFTMRREAEYYHQIDAKADRLVAEGFTSTWSPDGTELAYGRGYDGANGIEVLDLKSGRTRLVAVPGRDPFWSPDGRFIAFVRERQAKAISGLLQEHLRLGSPEGAGRGEVWIVAPTGDGLRRIAEGEWPTFGRQSKRVYFHSREENAVLAMAIDDPEAKPVRILSCGESFPSVSPDEKHIAYGIRSVLHIVEISSGNEVATWTSPSAATGLTAVWSPDGRELSVGGWENPRVGLWIYDLETREARKVFDGNVAIGVWSPDRTRMTFDVRIPHLEIWIARLDPKIPTAQALGPTQTPEQHFLQSLQRIIREMDECERFAGLIPRLASELDDFLHDLEENGRELAIEPLLAGTPRVPPYAAIDVILACESALERESGDTLIEKLRVLSGEADSRKRLLYFEGKLLERSGKSREAAEKLTEVVAMDGTRPEPFLSLARSLRAAGDSVRAEKELHAALEKRLPDDRDLWSLWAEVCLVDLGRSTAQMVAALSPPQAKRSAEEDDIRWFLERLQAGEAIRIDCGGGGHEEPDGKVWSRDRFFLAGVPARPWSGDIIGTDADPVYQTERYFPARHAHRALYRIPLPRGIYRVTLGFAEGSRRTRGERSFDVLLEGEALTAYEPLRSGFATRDVRTFEVRVDDGVLDIRFVHRVDNPMISAIEIESLE